VYGAFNKSEKSISLNLRSSDKSNFVSVQAGSFLYGTPFRGAIRPFEGLSYVELVIEIVSKPPSAEVWIGHFSAPARGRWRICSPGTELRL